MPRDVAKLSEVVFHKSISVVIRANTDRKARGCRLSFSANHCRGHPAARRECRALVRRHRAPLKDLRRNSPRATKTVFRARERRRKPVAIGNAQALR